MTGGPRIGDYELIDRHAVGGVAEIFRARDVRTGGVVAIKRMRPDVDFDPELTAGFLREVRVALLSTHDALVRGIDHGTANGLDYVVLQYVDGVDLARLVDRAKERGAAFSPDVACFVVAGILDGLAVAHDLREGGRPMGLVHRDLAPRNILVGYDGAVVVGDFGASCATLLEPPPTEVVGTPGYLSPEQARLEPLDRRSDLFAVGCVLHELLTGQPAFDVAGKNDAAVLKAHEKGAVRAPPKALAPALRDVLARACAAAPARRFPDAATMRAAIVAAQPSCAAAQPALAALVRACFVDEHRASRIA